MQKKIPMRQCMGCREMKPKRELIRVVRGTDGGVQLDFKGKAAGRGAYICHSAECLNRAIKARSLSRALDTAIPETIYESLKAQLGTEVANG